MNTSSSKTGGRESRWKKIVESCVYSKIFADSLLYRQSRRGSNKHDQRSLFGATIFESHEHYQGT